MMILKTDCVNGNHSVDTSFLVVFYSENIACYHFFYNPPLHPIIVKLELVNPGPNQTSPFPAPIILDAHPQPPLQTIPLVCGF